MHMPIRFHLKGQRFDHETLRVMGLAYEMALVALHYTDGTANPTREAVARKLSTLQKLASATRSDSVMEP
jgi:hypothetical protein